MSQWIPNGNGAHVRVCTCGTCNYSEMGACVYFKITVNGEEYKICPICGHFGEAQYAHIGGVKVGNSGHLHELICREYEEPFGEDDCVVMNYLWKSVDVVDSFTACKSDKGALVAWGAQESLYIPMPNPGDVTLVVMDYQGNFEEVPYLWYDGMLTFNADNHGLYLVIGK